LVDGKITTMLCAFLAAGLVAVASVLAPPVAAPSASFAETPSDSRVATPESPHEAMSGGTLIASAASDDYSVAFEVLSAVATPILVGDALAPGAGQGLQPLEARLLDLLNGERAERGLTPLQIDDRLVTLARNRSGDMARRNYFSHVTPEGEMVFKALDAEGVNYSLAGENLARNRSPLGESAEVAHRGFMNSPSHRENELEPSFDRVGIGVAFSDSGIIYFTELFISTR
jgi:uncharacterized protein YkwD